MTGFFGIRRKCLDGIPRGEHIEVDYDKAKEASLPENWESMDEQMREEFEDAEFVIEQKDLQVDVYHIYATPNVFGIRRRTHTLIATQVFSWNMIEK